MSVKAIPEGKHTVTPLLGIRNAVKALDFYKKALGAVELNRMLMPDGSLGHAEIRVGDSVIMLGEECVEHGCNSPESLGGSPVTLYLYVKDVDAVFNKALDAGAKELMPLMDQFWGDRTGQFEDPFGHIWWVATHKEDVKPDEMKKRAEAMFAQMK
jgi:PhnB protein